jgi:hypothetical protein
MYNLQRKPDVKIYKKKKCKANNMLSPRNPLKHKDKLLKNKTIKEIYYKDVNQKKFRTRNITQA